MHNATAALTNLYATVEFVYYSCDVRMALGTQLVKTECCALAFAV